MNIFQDEEKVKAAILSAHKERGGIYTEVKALRWVTYLALFTGASDVEYAAYDVGNDGIFYGCVPLPGGPVLSAAPYAIRNRTYFGSVVASVNQAGTAPVDDTEYSVNIGFWDNQEMTLQFQRLAILQASTSGVSQVCNVPVFDAEMVMFDLIRFRGDGSPAQPYQFTLHFSGWRADLG